MGKMKYFKEIDLFYSNADIEDRMNYCLVKGKILFLL